MSHFFAYLSRMKYINRWSLMRNTQNENLCEHSMEVAVIAHALAVIGNTKFGKNYNADKAAVIALFHDTPEIITGDIPTPVKNQNPELKKAYKNVESVAVKRLITLLPPELRDYYEDIIMPFEADMISLVKAADKISALIKCMEEIKMGNKEFISAYKSQKEIVLKIELEEVKYFINEFLDSYSLTLDELEK